jgi:hypothetical protein
LRVVEKSVDFDTFLFVQNPYLDEIFMSQY